MKETSAGNVCPSRPRAVLRLGFAGRRVLSPAEEETLAGALTQVFGCLGRGLAALNPGEPVPTGQAAPVTAFYARQPPLLRLVTGLCEGADTVAARVLDGLDLIPEAAPEATGTGPATGGNGIETELAGVLPFDLPAYRASRPDRFRADFDRQAERCAYLLIADGHYDKPDPDTALAQRRRGRGYRAQSALLLRQVDILVAAADPDAGIKAGGTLETVQAAMTCGLPVVFIDTRSGAVRIIEPGADIHAALDAPLPGEDDGRPDPGTGRVPDLQTRLADLVSWVLADPQLAPPLAAPGPAATEPPGLHLLREYFEAVAVPPLDRAGARRETWRGRVWNWFDRRFRRGPAPKKDAELPPYVCYRRRATELNYHYSGLYRGTFLVNYGLAVVAVALAALSLSLLAVVGGHAAPHWLTPTLLGLGFAKLVILSVILRNTLQANRENWNGRAVDYRYLAERLRALHYLPRFGSFQPPAAARPSEAQRAQRQTAVDWLFEAMLRAVSPAALAEPAEFPGHDGAGTLRVRVLTLAPRSALDLVCDPWLSGQIAYHRRNEHTNETMDRRAERAVTWLSRAVLGIVALDLLIVGMALTVPGLEAAHLLPAGPAETISTVTHALHGLAPWLLLGAALLPAAVAALNGLRFQSEAGRLAERSRTLVQTLAGRQREAQALLHRIDRAQADPGAWSLEALHLAERVADDCIHEVAEWSVLYAKELPEL